VPSNNFFTIGFINLLPSLLNKITKLLTILKTAASNTFSLLPPINEADSTVTVSTDTTK
jgi:hypothetical protein